MGLEESEVIAIIISVISLLIMVVLMLAMFNRIRIEIERNSLKNSTYSLLEHSYWKNQREIKNLKVQLKEAMADSMDAHEVIEKMNKAIENGTGRNS